MRNKILNFVKRKKAFSLIELSIVVLIIGLIIAAVIGGRKLVTLSNLSKARALTNSSPVAGIEDLALWLETTSKNSFSTTLTNGLSIGTWRDINPQKTIKNDATQGTGANQPTYLESGINGLPALDFTIGNVTYMTGNINMANSELTAFLVLSWRASPSGDFSRPLMIQNAAQTQDQEIQITNSGTIDALFWDGSVNSAYVDSTPTALGVSTASIITRVYSPSQNIADLYINGGKQGSTATAPNNIALGLYKLSISAAIQSMTASYGEVIVFNRALSSFERQQIEQYLSKKWGIKLT